MLKHVAPLAGPLVGITAPQYAEMIRQDIELMTELVDKLPEMTGLDENRHLAEVGLPRDAELTGGAPLRAVRRLLDELDSAQNWGGLRRVLTPEGHFFWLCEHHAKEYEK